MLLAYDPATGAVRAHSGTNSAFPDGLPDDVAQRWLDSLGDTHLEVLRVHDSSPEAARVWDSFVHVANGTLVVEGPLPRLTADSETVPADGVTPATFTFESGRAPAQVTFDVNGATATVDVVNGTATLEVVADAPGPVTVQCEGLSVTIEAEEVPA